MKAAYNLFSMFLRLFVCFCFQKCINKFNERGVRGDNPDEVRK